MSQQDSTTLWNKIWTARRMLELAGVQTHLIQGRKQQERWAASNHKAIYGEAADCNVDDDEMGDMTLGDRVENHYQRSNPLVTAAAVAGMLMGGGGLAALPFMLIGQQSSAPQQNVVDRVSVEKHRVEVLPPVIRSVERHDD